MWPVLVIHLYHYTEGRSIVLEATVWRAFTQNASISQMTEKYLLGGILVGDADAYNMLLQTSKNKVVLPCNPEDVILARVADQGGEGGAGVQPAYPMTRWSAVAKAFQKVISAGRYVMEMNPLDAIKVYQSRYRLWWLRTCW